MRHARRLAFLVSWLVLFDQFVPVAQQRLEQWRYEDSGTFRFENSDLFPLGPLVSYLREHPEGPRPRAVFFGNSVVFGFGLPASAALPAQVQDLEPSIRVLNLSVNGFGLGSAYLITKAVIGSVDRIYVQIAGTSANETLPSLIPIDDEDIDAFQLDRPSGLERRLDAFAGSWRLYGASYRLQAALFGTSSKQYVYLHKGEFVRNPLALGRTPTPRERVDAAIEVVAPRAAQPPDARRRDELHQRFPVLWRMEDVVLRHRKRAVFFLIGEADYSGLDEDDMADLNAVFAPFADVVRFRFSEPRMTYDGLHLTAGGARRLAEALVQLERRTPHGR